MKLFQHPVKCTLSNPIVTNGGGSSSVDYVVNVNSKRPKVTAEAGLVRGGALWWLAVLCLAANISR
jgi:hypothetical protein